MLKRLNLLIILIVSTYIVGCSHLSSSKSKIVDCKKSSEIEKIEAHIKVVQPELSKLNRRQIACNIGIVAKKHDIDPKIFVAIIDTESNFNQEKISETGDLSIAQINTEVWNKEFERMRKSKIDTKKLVSDTAYAVKVMGEILNILKSRFSDKDKEWFARYHSGSEKHKSDYLSKLELRFKMISESNT